jgi:hypothetical protein
VREVRVRIETGTVLRILSTDLDAPAQDIADLYKRRWAIDIYQPWCLSSLKWVLASAVLGVAEAQVA